MGLGGVEYIAINADELALSRAMALKRIQMGEILTRGLGAGTKPEIGKQAAEESRSAIADALKGAAIVFIIAGMGGGSGTGAAPVVAACAREVGALAVALVTIPFRIEGNRRMLNAEKGIKELRQEADMLVAVSNDKFFQIFDKKVELKEAFKYGDE